MGWTYRAHLLYGKGLTMIYLFHRTLKGEPFFYPVDLTDDSEVLPNVESNPGTVKVTTTDGRIVWILQ